MKKTYRIAVIPGDGIGKEVAPEGVQALEQAAPSPHRSSRWGEGRGEGQVPAQTARAIVFAAANATLHPMPSRGPAPHPNPLPTA